ncbi:MAG: hypothetical protein JNL32_13600 [Candidatus Kapabacteria bacterium]|nr:hypothetical protein [Candidatus Kapabacteria bacterium]
MTELKNEEIATMDNFGVNGYAIEYQDIHSSNEYQGVLREVDPLMDDFYIGSMNNSIKTIIATNKAQSIGLSYINYTSYIDVLKVLKYCVDSIWNYEVLTLSSKYLYDRFGSIPSVNGAELMVMGFDIIPIGCWSLLKGSVHCVELRKKYKLNAFGLLDTYESASAYIVDYHELSRNEMVEPYEDYLGELYTDIIQVSRSNLALFQ